nr:UDP-N-acetylgalactosamine-undecaprenyl-phosphate N-acetylgalactosaminephosphotransferase [uncultured bacterium]
MLLDNALKRALDVTLSSAALAVLAVPMAACAVAIKLDSPGPIFYRGDRVGKGGRAFKLVKFRSMVTKPGGATSTSANDPRITRVGHILRKYKLDEFPQFINVLRGDMSLVGPRPEVQRFVDLYTPDEKVILEVRPGITDWASIRFHNEGEIIAASGIADADEAYAKLIRPEKLRLQLKYVRERSIATDLRILAETFATLTKTRVSGSMEQVS